MIFVLDRGTPIKGMHPLKFVGKSALRLAQKVGAGSIEQFIVVSL